MGFVTILLRLIAIFLWLIAAFCALLVWAFSNERDVKVTPILFYIIVCLLSGLGGVGVFNYAKSYSANSSFSNAIKNNDKSEAHSSFYKMSEDDRENSIEKIFNQFYSKNLKDELLFLQVYGDNNLPFIREIRNDVKNRIEELYLKADSSNRISSISSQIPGDVFLQYADERLVRIEFRKWNSDDEAWLRALSWDSEKMLRQYLTLYPTGKYIKNAKSLILDYAYNSFSKKPSFKVSNVIGLTTVIIHNSSSELLHIRYNGTFDEGTFTLLGYSSKSLVIPNGYYSFSATSSKGRVRNNYSMETLNGGTQSYEYTIVTSN